MTHGEHTAASARRVDAMTGREVYRAVRQRLAQAGKPAFDAACLFEKHLHMRREELPLRGGNTAVSDAVCAALWEDVERRASGEPLQYLLGEWEFMGLPFKVGPGVLIPRQETELLAETAIYFLQNGGGGSSARLLELCAGSGCVAISVAKATDCGAVCLELSTDALAFLRRNILLHQLEGRVRAVRGDMLLPPDERLSGPFDVLLCNPPYIRTEELAGLQEEVRHEPVFALDGGADGLRFYRALCEWIPVLRPGGLLACEVGMGQSEAVAGLLAGGGLGDVVVQNDYADIGRMVYGIRPDKR